MERRQKILTLLGNISREIGMANHRLHFLQGYLQDLLVLESGHFHLHRVKVNTQILAKSISREISDRNPLVAVKTHFAGSFPFLYIDEEWISKALVYVLQEAVESTPPGGEICLFAFSEEKRYVVFEIVNEQHYRPDTSIKDLFDTFCKVPADKPGADGMGILIARSIILAHKGILYTNRKNGSFSAAIILGENEGN